MPAIHATFDRTVRELRDVTEAFLTDRYNNGDHVATADDIAELQAATAAFLADQTDGEYVYLEDGGHGLLLPGEQFLLPISTAVGRVRSDRHALRNVIDLIDECLDAEVLFEDVPDTPRLDGAAKESHDQDVVYTSFVDILGPASVPKTPRTPTLTISVTTPTVTIQTNISMTPTITIQTTTSHHSQLATDSDSDSGYSWVSLEEITKYPNEADRLVEIFDDDEDNITLVDTDVLDAMSEVTSDISDIAFDGPDALCPAHASDSAAFFDPTTETLVPYTSLDSLLQMDYQNDHIARSDRASDMFTFYDSNSDTDSDEGDRSGMFTFYDSDSDTDSDEGSLDPINGDLDPSTTQVDNSSWQIYIDHSAILAGELSSAISDSSADSANGRWFIYPLSQRQVDSLVNEGNLSLTPTSTIAVDAMEKRRKKLTISDDVKRLFEKETIVFSEMFNTTLWNYSPDLTLTMPGEQRQSTKLVEARQ